MHDYLSSGAYMIGSMVLVLGVMILVHEWGHYIAAKLLGVRVETFAIGFGPRLVGFKRNGTDYRISLLPLGGYVKMAGENPFEGRSGDPGEFMSHPRWHRFIIAIAGPAMNIILAVALMTGVYMVHYEHPAYADMSTVAVVEANSPAAKAGLQDGDRIIRIDNTQDPRWIDIQAKIAINPNQPVNLAVQRDGKILDMTLTPQASGANDMGVAGLYPARPLKVGRLEPGLPAEKAGLKSGDEIQTINGAPVLSIEHFVKLLDKNAANPIDLSVSRNGQTVNVKLSAIYDNELKRYRIGFAPSEVTRVDTLPFGQAVSRSIETNKKGSSLILQIVEKMLHRPAMIRQVSGPIQIAVYSGEAARQSIWKLLELMSEISLNLGIFNLFPIPILDGGVILLLLIEGIIRRDISQAIKERIYQAAFVFLVLFAVMVIYNDLLKTIPGLAQRMP
jgi:regulator of sigma E protease